MVQNLPTICKEYRKPQQQRDTKIVHNKGEIDNIFIKKPYRTAKCCTGKGEGDGMFECTYVLRGGEEGVREKPMVARRPSSAPQKERWGGYSRHAVLPTYLFRPPPLPPKRYDPIFPHARHCRSPRVRYMARRANFAARDRTFFYCAGEEEEEVSNLVQTDDDAETPLLRPNSSLRRKMCTHARYRKSFWRRFAFCDPLLEWNGCCEKYSIECKKAAERTKGRRVENPT